MHDIYVENSKYDIYVGPVSNCVTPTLISYNSGAGYHWGCRHWVLNKAKFQIQFHKHIHQQEEQHGEQQLTFLGRPINKCSFRGIVYSQIINSRRRCSIIPASSPIFSRLSHLFLSQTFHGTMCMANGSETLFGRTGLVDFKWRTEIFCDL